MFDTQVYLLYLDDLYWYPQPGWFLSEPLAKSYLLGLRWLTGSTDDAIEIAHFIVGVIFLAGTVTAFRPTRSDPRGMLVAFALYGPQLALITLRATPAYMLVALASVDATLGRRRCFIFLSAAALFHVSSVFAFVPVLLAFLQVNSRLLGWVERPRNLIVLASAFGLTLLFMRQQLFDLAAVAIESVPFLGKYVVFLIGLSSDASQTKTIAEFSIEHFLLFGGLTFLLAFYVFAAEGRSRRMLTYVTSSYLVYVFTFFALSPIAAWRQSAFWAIPMFTAFPWARLGWRGALWPVVVAGLSIVFWIQLSSVYT